MPYKRVKLDDIKDTNYLMYDCPCCGDYCAKTKYAVIKHLDNCDENYDQGSSPEDIIIGDEEDGGCRTAETILNDRDIVIKTIKKFIKTNELEKIASKPGKDIREYIKEKLINITDKYEINNYIFTIYGIFFEMSEEDKDAEKKEVHDPLFERLLRNL